MIKAFISHSSVQKEFAQQLVNLIGRDFCIIDCYDFRPSYRSIDEIFSAIERCTVFVLLLSEESLASDWVSKEISAAIRKFGPFQLNHFWPYIIDPCLQIEDCPEWIRKNECFNLRYFKSPELLRMDIEQKFRKIIWSDNPDIQAMETVLVGRQDEMDQFERIRFSMAGKELRSLIISGRAGVGKDAFARQCMYKIGRHAEFEPCRISLERKNGLEDFIVQLNLITLQYDEIGIKAVLSSSYDEKVTAAISLLNTIFDGQNVVFVEDNMACVLPTRDMPYWISDIIDDDRLNNQLALIIKSRIAPNSYIREEHPRVGHIQLHSLNKIDRKKLFYSLAEHYRASGFRESDVEFFADKLLHSPSQIHQAVKSVAKDGVIIARNDIERLIRIGDERAKPLIDHFKTNKQAMQLMVILAKYEFLGFDVLETIFEDNQTAMHEAIAEMMVYGIVSTFGLSGEYLRLDHYICDYVKRNNITLPKEESDAVTEIIERYVTEANIVKDVSLYFYNLRQGILRGKFSSDAFLVPSVIVKAVIDAYDSRNYKQVITICEKILSDSHTLNDEVKWELTYWLCLALCRKLEDNDRNRERFWELVKQVKGADGSFLKGFFFRYDRQPARAEICFREALNKSPNMERAKRELVTVMLDQRKYDQARDMARENYERGNGDNTYHIYAYFRCLVRKTPIQPAEVSMLRKLMKEVTESYSDKKEELLAAMQIDFDSIVERKNPTEMIQILKEAKAAHPDSVNVGRAINDYRRRQGLS